jgi:hypothetical protein
LRFLLLLPETHKKLVGNKTKNGQQNDIHKSAATAKAIARQQGAKQCSGKKAAEDAAHAAKHSAGPGRGSRSGLVCLLTILLAHGRRRRALLHEGLAAKAFAAAHSGGIGIVNRYYGKSAEKQHNSRQDCSNFHLILHL